eukprot:3804832-Pyramimonas_sp.AAC.2
MVDGCVVVEGLRRRHHACARCRAYQGDSGSDLGCCHGGRVVAGAAIIPRPPRRDMLWRGEGTTTAPSARASSKKLLLRRNPWSWHLYANNQLCRLDQQTKDGRLYTPRVGLTYTTRAGPITRPDE